MIQFLAIDLYVQSLNTKLYKTRCVVSVDAVNSQLRDVENVCVNQENDWVQNHKKVRLTGSKIAQNVVVNQIQIHTGCTKFEIN